MMNEKSINTYEKTFKEKNGSQEKDENSLVVTSSSSASSLETSVSNKNEDNQSLSQQEQNMKTPAPDSKAIPSPQEHMEIHIPAASSYGTSLRETPAASKDVIESRKMTEIRSSTIQETTTNVQLSEERQPNEAEKSLDPNSENNSTKINIETVHTSLQSITRSEENNPKKTDEKSLTFYSQSKSTFPQGVYINSNQSSMASPKLNENSKQTPSTMAITPRQSSDLSSQMGYLEDKASFSIAGQIAQSLLSSKNSLSAPPLKITAPALHPFNSSVPAPTPKKKTSVFFTPSSVMNSPPPNNSTRPYQQRFRSNSDSFTAIKQSRLRNLSNHKINGVSNNNTPNNTAPLRRGKWTVEEEEYVARVIRDFNSGYLNAPAGTTLRTYLSEKLHCDPMRITKKFTGDSCIGKRVFHPAVRCGNNADEIDASQVSSIIIFNVFKFLHKIMFA